MGCGSSSVSGPGGLAGFANDVPPISGFASEKIRKDELGNEGAGGFLGRKNSAVGGPAIVPVETAAQRQARTKMGNKLITLLDMFCLLESSIEITRTPDIQGSKSLVHSLCSAFPVGGRLPMYVIIGPEKMNVASTSPEVFFDKVEDGGRYELQFRTVQRGRNEIDIKETHPVSSSHLMLNASPVRVSTEEP